jgi:hypothetical protein
MFSLLFIIAVVAVVLTVLAALIGGIVFFVVRAQDRQPPGD